MFESGTTLGGPVGRLGLPPEVTTRLRVRGIVTCAQLYDFVTGAPSSDVAAVLSMAPREAVTLYGNPRHMGVPPVGTTSIPDFRMGLVGPVESDSGAHMERELTADGRRRLIERAEELEATGELPTRVNLARHDPCGVLDQGTRGTCVGFGASAERQLSARVSMAPLFAYALAKQYDSRPNLEGSWLRYAYRGFTEIGHLPEKAYPYREDFSQPLPIDDRHRAKGARYRIRGYSDVRLSADEMEKQPVVLKAILAGRLSRRRGPQPVAAGFAIHRSFFSATTRATGLVVLPSPGEPCVGGHAMCVMGYVDKHDPGALYDTTYFLVKNSWGTNRWASQSPVALAGYCLIPEAYFTRAELFWEAVISIAEPSPVRVRRADPGPGWGWRGLVPERVRNAVLLGD